MQKGKMVMNDNLSINNTLVSVNEGFNRGNIFEGTLFGKGAANPCAVTVRHRNIPLSYFAFVGVNRSIAKGQKQSIQIAKDSKPQKENRRGIYYPVLSDLR